MLCSFIVAQSKRIAKRRGGFFLLYMVSNSYISSSSWKIFSFTGICGILSVGTVMANSVLRDAKKRQAVFILSCLYLFYETGRREM